jgi:hypothetical protein
LVARKRRREVDSGGQNPKVSFIPGPRERREEKRGTEAREKRERGGEGLRKGAAFCCRGSAQGLTSGWSSSPGVRDKQEKKCLVRPNGLTEAPPPRQEAYAKVGHGLLVLVVDHLVPRHRAQGAQHLAGEGAGVGGWEGGNSMNGPCISGGREGAEGDDRKNQNLPPR